MFGGLRVGFYLSLEYSADVNAQSDDDEFHLCQAVCCRDHHNHINKDANNIKI